MIDFNAIRWKIINDDLEGMEMLYDKYAEAIFFTICQLVPEVEKSEEILINVFQKIWNERTALPESQDAFYIWLFKMTRNAASGNSFFSMN